jgi:transposase-like protein
MPQKNPPTGTDKDLNMATMAAIFSSEDKAREFLEKKRWPNGPICPHCDCKEIYTLTARAGSNKPVRKGVYKCSSCRKQFTVQIGTILEESKIPICKWLMAIHLMTSSKKGVSSHQIARECGITQKTAWFLNHRIREAMKKEPMAGMLQGTVEIDETYVGGKPRKGTGPHKRGRGTDKTPVVVLVERDGNAVATPLENVTAKSLIGEAKKLVSPSAVMMTDELSSYDQLGEIFAGHETVNHSAGEYSRTLADGTKAHNNTAESFFALLKRGHYGIFHQLSKAHLHRYCTEFGFRWDHRKVSDGERMTEAIKGVEGKRLMYREPVSGLIKGEGND